MRGVCQTVRHAPPAVADPTGLLARPPSQPGQGGPSGPARGRPADSGPLSGWGRTHGDRDRALYAIGLSGAYAEDQPEHFAVLSGHPAGLTRTPATTDNRLH